MRLLAALLLIPLLTPAAVHRVYVSERTDVLNGQSFGSAGPYESISATVHFRLDPQAPANRIITDIALAPRNEQGQVEFSADLFVLKPRDSARGNGTILFEVPNRGGRGMVNRFNLVRAPGDPRGAAEFGDRFLFEQGYTLVWLGWQWDAPARPGVLRMYPPSALIDGQPVSGRTRADFVPDEKGFSFPLADMNHEPYPAADRQEPEAVLTERDAIDAPRRTIPRADWQFAREEKGQPVPDPGFVYVRSGLVPGRIYEIVYTTNKAPLVGLGPAAIRDLISFLKFGGEETLLGDQRRYMKRAIGYGISQSGRFLRKFLYDGFNADEKDRPVFDAVWAQVAGAGRGSFNHRFAQASRDARPYLNFDYATDLFPFTDQPETDPFTHQRAGLLDRAREQKVAPKLFLVNTSYEYWGRAAALIHVTPDGKADAALGADTRVYYLTGNQHFPGTSRDVPKGASYPGNVNSDLYLERGLLTALHRWVKEGVTPPESRYPRLDRSELTPLAGLRFPAIPEVKTPIHPLVPHVLDFGPQFATAGLITVEPPKRGPAYPLLVPQVDSDGNEIAGIRMPEVAVPLGTSTGWNLRSPSLGAAGEMASFVGSYLPFARTEADRQSRRDPRPSREKRYPGGVNEYVRKVQAATDALINQGFLLAVDRDAVVERCRKLWD